VPKIYKNIVIKTPGARHQPHATTAHKRTDATKKQHITDATNPANTYKLLNPLFRSQNAIMHIQIKLTTRFK
jgi:hypothetical protein